MASLRILRRQIRSTQNTKQIMRAMQLVSGSKLKRAQGRLLQGREVLQFLDGLLHRVLASMAASQPRKRGQSAGAPTHPLCMAHGNAPEALVLFTSDTGLCSSYNTNLIQLAEAQLRRDSRTNTQLIYIGKKGHRYFTKRGYPAAQAYLDLAGRPDPRKAEAIGKDLIQRFLAGQFSAVHVLYSRFVSAMVYRPIVEPWLPIVLPAETGETKKPAAASSQQPSEYIFEPSPQRVFEDLLPRWALAKFQLMMLEAFTSEHSARMIAMKNATDNAEKFITELTMQRNKIRQAAITKEISEIVGTAEALK